MLCCISSVHAYFVIDGFNDTFYRPNSQTIGNGWSETENGGNVSILNNYAFFNDYKASSGSVELSHSLTGANQTVPDAISFVVQANYAGGTEGRYLYVLKSGTPVLYVGIENDAIQYFDGSWKSLSSPIGVSVNTDYSVDLRNISFVSHTYSIYVDGVLRQSGAAFASNQASVDSVNLRVDGNTNKNVSFRNVVVGKLFDNGINYVLFGNISYNSVAFPNANVLLTNSTGGFLSQSSSNSTGGYLFSGVLNATLYQVLAFYVNSTVNYTAASTVLVNQSNNSLNLDFAPAVVSCVQTLANGLLFKPYSCGASW